MTNKKVICIVLGVMCFALTAAICIQINTVKNSNSTVSQSHTQNNLRAEVLKYKEKYDNLLKEIENIDTHLNEEITKATENNTELQQAKKEIEIANKMIGISEVKGPGVTIKVADSNIDSNLILNASDLLVHDKDLLYIVNELKNAGAEAISINDERIVSSTSIICGGNIISINGNRIGSPFIIKAIGLPETLANLDRPGGYLNFLRDDRQLQVELKKYNEIIIPKYTGILNFKYATSIN